MKRFIVSAALVVLVASLAQAQSGSGGGQAAGQANTTLHSNSAGSSTDASATAASSAGAQADFDRLQQDVRNKGAKVSVAARARAEAKLEAAAKHVDDTAAPAEDKVVNRLATEFGTTAEALTAEKNELDLSWGQLTIAHTLMGNAKTEITLGQLIGMHKDGMGWGQIAAGLGLKLGEVVSAVETEGRVASGHLRADGKVAVVHGEGAKAGLGLGTQAGLESGHGKVGANVGVETGIKVKP